MPSLLPSLLPRTLRSIPRLAPTSLTPRIAILPRCNPTLAVTRTMATVPSTTQTPHTSASSTSLPMLPEFALTDNIILVTGGARGLGLTQSSALISAGATVYVLDRLEEPDPNFVRLREKVGGEVCGFCVLCLLSSSQFLFFDIQLV
jgi:hypothetical protein